MKKQILSEEFIRMQKLAGIRENKINEDIDLTNDIINYEGFEDEYTPESIRKAIKTKDETKAIITNDGRGIFGPYGSNIFVDQYKLLNYLEKYLKLAGYDLPEDFWEKMEEEIEIGNFAGIKNMDDLEYFVNFTAGKAISLIKDFIEELVDDEDALSEFGLPEDTTSIEDFKN
jgi:hypothetical protein